MEIDRSWETIQQRIKGKNVTVIGVTKAQDFNSIITSAKLGILNIGESYVQEALPKIEAVKLNSDPALFNSITWHFIGRLQTNKIKMLDNRFSFIHSVYKISQLEELDKRINNKVGLFFEINTGTELSKGGTTNIDETKTLIEKCMEMNLKRIQEGKHELKPMGLMCIPPYSDDPEDSRKHFAFLRGALEKINKDLNANMSSLSMGMSSDYDIAIEEGATHVRIGSMLYGERSKV